MCSLPLVQFCSCTINDTCVFFPFLIGVRVAKRWLIEGGEAANLSGVAGAVVLAAMGTVAIVRETGKPTRILLNHSSGSNAEVSTFGATVVSWNVGLKERLFVRWVQCA